MSIERVNQLLKQKENLRLEFKEAKSILPDNLFETICAFLNRAGGDILLGVADNGSALGVNEVRVAQLMREIANLSNNPQKIDPPFILLPQQVDIGGIKLIHIQVPASSQVHRSKGVVFDRSEDGDYKVINHTSIAELYTRKSAGYSENTIYPALRFTDFKSELFPKVRNLIRSRDSSHPWLALDDIQLLQKAGLYRRDLHSGEKGYTQAAALILGQDEVIQSILPHYKTDALVRRQNLDRYDDRLYVQTNLIEAYDQLMGFIAKHLPDKFFIEGTIRINLRSKIFREVIANLLVHREFTNGFPSRLIIYHDRVETENANRPHTYGYLVPENFSPFPKNPVIAKFFTQLGYVDELGSGILNVNKYLPFYTPGKVPVFEEGDVFKMIIPVDDPTELKGNAIQDKTGDGSTDKVRSHENEGLNEGLNEGINEGINEGLNNRQLAALKLITEKQGCKAKMLEEILNITHATVERDIAKLKRLKLITYTGSKKSGKYIVTESGSLLLGR